MKRRKYFCLLMTLSMLLTLIIPASVTAEEQTAGILPSESMFSDWSNMESLKTDNWDCNYGTMFSTAVPGKITHIRAFGLKGETGDHTAYIWENGSGSIVGGPYIINYTGSNEWVEYELPEPVTIPEAGKQYTVVVTTGDTGLVPIEREGTAKAGNNGTSIYRPAEAGVFGPKNNARPTVSWRYNYLRDIVFVPSAVNPAVTEVNTAADPAGIKAAIEKYPQWLDLSQYNRLSEDDRNNVVQALLDGRQTGYERVLNIQQMIDAKAEGLVNAETAAAVAKVNQAATADELAQALTSPFLELRFDLYGTLKADQKVTVLENILSSKPAAGFADRDDVAKCFEAEVKGFLYEQLTPNDPSFFPIGVWMQNPSASVMEQYKAIGINTYISLSSGSFNETLYNRLKQYGMKAIVNQNKYARDNMDKAEEVVLAWLQQDEPDTAQFTKDWWPLPPKTPASIQDVYRGFKSYNQSIPVYMNLSQGVAKPDWTGRGVDTYETYMYPEYAKGADILSFDVYCVNSGYDLSYIGKGVDNLYKYSDGKQPVWAFVETTKFDAVNAGRPTPEQVKAQVWIALVHGAKGIEYFCHVFTPDFIEAGPLHESYTDTREMLTSINAQITELAPVLNSPVLAGFASVESSNKDVTIDTVSKEYEGSQYIFSVGVQADSTTATFRVESEGYVEVLGENRVINIVDGKFNDEFGPNEVHLYKVHNTAELSSMINAAFAAGQIQEDGIMQSLSAKLDKINYYGVENRDTKNLYNALNALKNEVKAQAGKKIEADFADRLLDAISQFLGK